MFKKIEKMGNKKEILVSVEMLEDWIDRIENFEMTVNLRCYLSEDISELINKEVSK